MSVLAFSSASALRDRTNAADFFDQLQSTHAWQRDVRNHQVPLAGAYLLQGAGGVGRFADHRILDAIGEDGANALTRHRVIVDKENTNHRDDDLTFRARDVRSPLEERVMDT